MAPWWVIKLEEGVTIRMKQIFSRLNWIRMRRYVLLPLSRHAGIFFQNVPLVERLFLVTIYYLYKNWVTFLAWDYVNILEMRKIVWLMTDSGFDIMLYWYGHIVVFHITRGLTIWKKLVQMVAVLFIVQLNWGTILISQDFIYWQSAWDVGETGRFCYSIVPRILLSPGIVGLETRDC